jgi:hypothetical protein
MLQRADEERDELAPSHGIAHPVDDVAPRRISDWEPAVSGQDECLATGQDRWRPVNAALSRCPVSCPLSLIPDMPRGSGAPAQQPQFGVRLIDEMDLDLAKSASGGSTIPSRIAP